MNCMRIGHRKKRKQWIAGAFGVCAAVVADQLTKELAYRNLKLSGKGFVTLIPGVLELRYLENRGAAFGMLQNRLPLFILFAAAVSLAAIICYIRVPDSRRYLALRVCMAGLTAGAVGNLIDRIFRGYVIDFIYISLIHFPIFNVADICVSLSAGLLLVLMLFVYRDGELEIWTRSGSQDGKDEKKG